MQLSFVKLAGSWFAHLPDYPGDPGDLLMVEGADELCDIIEERNKYLNGIITIEVFEEVPSDEIYDFKLTFDELLSDGAIYTVDNDMSIWLCSVTKYVFGGFPKTLYVIIKND